MAGLQAVFHLLQVLRMSDSVDCCKMRALIVLMRVEQASRLSFLNEEDDRLEAYPTAVFHQPVA